MVVFFGCLGTRRSSEDTKVSEGKPEIALLIAEWLICGNARSFGNLKETEASKGKPEIADALDKEAFKTTQTKRRFR
jgi:hypothetical protein